MKKRMLLLTIIVGLVLGFYACVAEDDDDDEVVPWTWERLARSIDNQLGEIATGVSPECDGNAVTWGTHCKNNLQGKVSSKMVALMVALNKDCSWPGYVHTDWRPLSEDLCTFDGDTNGTPDIYEVCETYGATAAAGTIECEKTDENKYKLKYIDCSYENPFLGCWYNINGQIKVNSYFTRRGELVTEIKYVDYKAERISNAPYSVYKFNGYEVLYKVLDPITGEQVTGTTGNPDGMRIMKSKWNVDHDGPSGPAVTGEYKIRFAEDEEDGLALFNAYGNAVWYDQSVEVISGSTIEMTFYDKDHPWNDLPTGGCRVDAVNIDTTNRTFDLVSEGAYGNGCLPDQTGLSY